MQSFKHRVCDPKSGRTLEATVTRVGHDLVIVVGGGSEPHVGSLVLAQPHASFADPRRSSVSISVLTIPPHKEEPVARCIAEAVCRTFGRVTVVTAGIHEENLDPEGIEL